MCRKKEGCNFFDNEKSFEWIKWIIYRKQKARYKKMYGTTVKVPAYEFKFNLVLCPLPEGIADVSLLKQNLFYSLLWFKGWE